VEWNPLTGEITIVEDDDRLTDSNIVDIIHHALKKGPRGVEPTGYTEIYPFLPFGSTPPDDINEEQKQLKKERKKKKKKKKEGPQKEKTFRWKDINDNRSENKASDG